VAAPGDPDQQREVPVSVKKTIKGWHIGWTQPQAVIALGLEIANGAQPAPIVFGCLFSASEVYERWNHRKFIDNCGGQRQGDGAA
jgi:hypothetical protein